MAEGAGMGPIGPGAEVDCSGEPGGLRCGAEAGRFTAACSIQHQAIALGEECSKDDLAVQQNLKYYTGTRWFKNFRK